MKKIILTLFACLSLSLAGPALTLGTAYAACPENGTAKGQVLQGLGQTGSDCSGDGVDKFANTIVRIISYLAGIVAIIMILISAFKYITSGGDSSKIASAKSTLMYALVGLVIAALAQVLVNVVLSESNNATSFQNPTNSNGQANRPDQGAIDDSTVRTNL